MRNFANAIQQYYGTLTINPPAGTTALTVYGSNLANTFPANFIGASVAGNSNGVFIAAGVNNAGDRALDVFNYAQTIRLMGVFGDGHFSLGYNGSSATLTGSAAGNVTINVPSSGVALTVNSQAVIAGVVSNGSVTFPSSNISATLMGDTGSNGSYTTGAGLNASFDGTNWRTGTDGGSNGAGLILSQHGSGNLLFYVIPSTGGSNQSISNASLSSYLAASLSSSGVQIGSPTGSAQGAGTINAQGLYINGAQLFFGVPASSNTTASVTDVGKVINAAGTITIPNSVFSQGHAFSIYNNSGSSITISAGITTMRLAGTATTGSRTLAQRGMATVWFESGTECVVGGPGVT
jgi:hypothetical protein